MSTTVTIEDDPHAEGGHALIHVVGAARMPATGTLLIEILTEGFDYRGPRRIETSPVATEGGFNMAIGPDVVGALRQGLAVNLRADGGGLDVDLLWPNLTPPRATARRAAMSNTKPKRRVVASDGASQTAPPQAEGVVTFVRPTPVDETPHQRHPVVVSPQPKVEVETLAETLSPPAVVDTAPPHEVVVEPSKLPVVLPVPVSAKPKGWSLPRVAAVGLVAFLLGAGAMALLEVFKPPQPVSRPLEGKADVDLASPYDLLADLPTRSPDGVRVTPSDSISYRKRAQTAASTSEADFWRLWSLHASLDSRTTDVAAALGDFAVVMANAHRSAGDIATARIVWELAAIGKDCNAMDNLAATYSLESPSDRSTVAVPQQTSAQTKAITTWHHRADACRERAMSKR